jgi:PKD domain
MARRFFMLLCAIAATVLLAQGSVDTARACSLDGVASLSANGTMASLNGDSATASTLKYWAPFSLLAAAPGDRLRLAENLSNVRKSIPAQSARLPFTWTFGDGVTAIGQTVSHSYARTGWYRIAVRYYWPAHRQWVEFDSAEQHIVPQGDLLRANIGYYAGNVILTIVRVAIWATLLGVLALLVLQKARPGARQRFRARRHAVGKGNLT